jgi:cytochrome P450
LLAELRSLPPGPVRLEDVLRLKYLTNFVNEVRRYYPFVSAVFGRAKKGFEISGYYVPKGWAVIAGFYSTNHGIDYTSPDQFNPDRFNQDGKDVNTHR